MGFRNSLPAEAMSFNPNVAGLLGAQNVQGAIDELAGRVPPTPPDCSSFLDSANGLTAIVEAAASEAANVRNQQTAIAIQLQNGGLSQAEIDALNAENDLLQAQLDGLTAQIATAEADRAAAYAAYQSCSGETPNVGTTAARPATPATGFCYFDTDIGRPVWFKGVASGWVDADGNPI